MKVCTRKKNPFPAKRDTGVAWATPEHSLHFDGHLSMSSANRPARPVPIACKSKRGHADTTIMHSRSRIIECQQQAICICSALVNICCPGGALRSPGHLYFFMRHSIATLPPIQSTLRRRHHSLPTSTTFNAMVSPHAALSSEEARRSRTNGRFGVHSCIRAGIPKEPSRNSLLGPRTTEPSTRARHGKIPGQDARGSSKPDLVLGSVHIF